MWRDRSKGKRVLHSWDDEPPTGEFWRRISDSPRVLARFESTWGAFDDFLRASGMIDGGGNIAMTRI